MLEMYTPLKVRLVPLTFYIYIDNIKWMEKMGPSLPAIDGSKGPLVVEVAWPVWDHPQCDRSHVHSEEFRYR